MNRLKELRKEKNITLVELSEELGIPRSTINRYENEDSEPKQETWEKLADYYGVSTAYLMGISNQRISEEKALDVARKVYQYYLSDDDLGKEILKALEYFNNNDLDIVLKQAMQQYFTIPAVEWNTEWQTLESSGFLYSWLEGYLVDRYRKEVKTNQNLITNTYYNIPSVDEINEYGHFSDEIQIPLTEDFKQIFKVEDLPMEIHEEIEKLFKSDSTLIAYSYESSIDDELKNEIIDILDEARSKIVSLKEKYPDKPSKTEQTTVLISRDKDSSLWSRNGSDDYTDELNLSESTKQVFIHIGAEFIKEKKQRSKNK